MGRVLETASAASDLAGTVDAAAAFLVEILAPYEMARQGFLENAALPKDPDEAGRP